MTACNSEWQLRGETGHQKSGWFSQTLILSIRRPREDEEHAVRLPRPLSLLTSLSYFPFVCGSLRHALRDFSKSPLQFSSLEWRPQLLSITKTILGASCWPWGHLLWVWETAPLMEAKVFPFCAVGSLADLRVHKQGQWTRCMHMHLNLNYFPSKLNPVI